MLSRDYRLQVSGEVRFVLAHGRSLREGPFTLKYMVIPGNTFPRFAFVVPTSVSKRATVRNLVRRRARSVVENQLQQGQFLPSDVVVLMYKGSETLSFARVQDILVGLFNKAGISKTVPIV